MLSGPRVGSDGHDRARRSPRVESQPCPLRECGGDVQRDRGDGKAQRPSEAVRNSAGGTPDLARKLTLQEIGRGGDRGAVLIPAPRRAARERRRVLRRPRAQLRIVDG